MAKSIIAEAFVAVVGLITILLLCVLAAGIVLAQAQNTPLQIETPHAQPTKAFKSPTAPHHHYDRRHPHRGAKPQLQNPQQKQD